MRSSEVLRYAPSMRLPPLSFVVFDTETTGTLPRVSEIIEFASMRVQDGEIVETYEQLCSVKEIPPHVQVLTRIRPEHLLNAPTFDAARPTIEQHLGNTDLLVGQNLGFDLSMVKAQGIDLSDRPWIDTSLLASLVFPELRSYSLPYMSAQLKLTHEPAHRALGDVRATLELLGRIWERLLELPRAQQEEAKAIMQRASEGYRLLFDALPVSESASPAWLGAKPTREISRVTEELPLAIPAVGSVILQEERLDPGTLQSILNAAARDLSVTHWIAVKNLDSALKRLTIPEGVCVLHPPSQMLNPEAAAALHTQEYLTAEEATLALKISWYMPRTRNDAPIHGGERDVWNGKLACTEDSTAYRSQFETDATTFLIDHRQLLSFLEDPLSRTHGALTPAAHVIIDDASMLEDTATKEFGHFCGIDALRAAAGTNDDLTAFVDALSLWAERARQNEDQHILQKSDYPERETKALRSRTDELLTTTLPDKTRQQLQTLVHLLNPDLVTTHIVWIERRQDGGLTLQSAPERIDALLKDLLFSQYRTTLLTPRGVTTHIPEVLAASIPVTTGTTPKPLPFPIPVSFEREQTVSTFLRSPPAGKTVILMGSKRVIEQVFIEHTEALEAQGVTIICQGLSGGQGRMESDFIAAPAPAIWILTPAFYEGMDLPEGTVDTLVIDTVPFDSPAHPVIGRRKDHFKSGFNDYCLPRAEYRLFRLLRTFCRHRSAPGRVFVFDKRLFQKDYGRKLMAYLSQWQDNATTSTPSPVQPTLPL